MNAVGEKWNYDLRMDYWLSIFTDIKVENRKQTKKITSLSLTT
jgi:hypothetical protein